MSIGTAEHVLNCISQHAMDDNETKEQALAHVDKLAHVTVAGYHHQALDLGDIMVIIVQQQQQNNKTMENGTAIATETTKEQQQQSS